MMLASMVSQVAVETVPVGLAIIPSFGWQETLLIFGVVLLIFGPQKLPEIADALGRSIRKFKNATREIKSDIESDPTPPPNQHSGQHTGPHGSGGAGSKD